jgi:hypothetical protein
VFLDKVTPYYTVRWVVWVLLLIAYGVRVYFLQVRALTSTFNNVSLLINDELEGNISCHTVLQGWYIITYALGIYLLNLFIGFLTPKIDPAVVDGTCF